MFRRVVTLHVRSWPTYIGALKKDWQPYLDGKSFLGQRIDLIDMDYWNTVDLPLFATLHLRRLTEGGNLPHVDLYEGARAALNLSYVLMAVRGLDLCH